MNHNPLNFKPGDTAVLDADMAHPVKVVIMEMTPMQLYSRVRLTDKPDSEGWEVMTNRLFKEVVSTE